MPRLAAGPGRCFPEPNAGLSRTVRFSSTAPATERGASVSVHQWYIHPWGGCRQPRLPAPGRTRSELPARSLTGSYRGPALNPPALLVLPAPRSGPRPCTRGVLNPPRPGLRARRRPGVGEQYGAGSRVGHPPAASCWVAIVHRNTDAPLRWLPLRTIDRRRTAEARAWLAETAEALPAARRRRRRPLGAGRARHARAGAVPAAARVRAGPAGPLVTQPRPPRPPRKGLPVNRGEPPSPGTTPRARTSRTTARPPQAAQEAGLRREPRTSPIRVAGYLERRSRGGWVEFGG